MLERGRHNQAYQPSLPDERYQYRNDDWQEMMPSARCRLPEYLPDVAAGASAPIQLTDWKIKALKLLVLLDDTGYVTRSDFKRFGLDIRRWIGEKAWLEPCEKGFRARGDLIANFRSQHPRVWQEIVADRPKWDRRVAMLL